MLSFKLNKSAIFYFTFLIGTITNFSYCKADKIVFFEFDKNLSTNNHLSYKYLKVIDKREEKENLGSIKYGIWNNKTETFQTKTNFDKELSGFANSLANNKITTSDTAILDLYDFQFDLKLPVATFYLRAQIFTGKNNKYHLFRNVDTLFEWKGYKIEKLLFEETNNQIFQLLKSITTSEIQHDSVYYSFSQAAKFLEERKKQFPIYNVTNFKRGIYITIDDFLNNKPYDTSFIQSDVLKNFKNVPEFYYVDESGNKKSYVRSVFIIYNGEKWYHWDQNNWVIFDYYNNDFYTTRFFSGLKGANPYGNGFLVTDVVNAVEGDQYVYPYIARLNPIEKKYYRVKRTQ